MSLRDMIVHVDAGPEGASRLRLAVDLAGRHAARLTVIHVRERSVANDGMLRAAELGLMPASALERIENDIDAHLLAQADALQSTAEHEARQAGVTTIFRSEAGSAADLVPQHARLADLAIVGHGGQSRADLPFGFSFGEAILFATGRPVLLVPARAPDATLGRRVALAWNGSRPAARALTDAMPLIERADELIVLIAHPVRAPAAALPPDAVLDHLRLHCARVTARSLDLPHDRVAAGLQTAAVDAGADLLVAGAYGHPKLWERLLGGVTRDLLCDTRLPLLMAH